MRILITGANGFIGTNLVMALRSAMPHPYEAVLVDPIPPKIELNTSETWHPLDILDQPAVERLFASTKPEIVIHLAAETRTDPGLTLDDYRVNIKGSEHVFNACQSNGTSFLIHTSTQFVNQAAHIPSSDTDYAPHTVYGESKVLAEQLLREGSYTFNWCIVRPTNIWGSWHLRYPSEFWKVLKEGKYLHPGKKEVIRSYGYVGNVCWQMIEIIKRRHEAIIAKNVFYVGDQPVNMFEWTNEFSLAINQKPVRVVPSSVVYMLAITGSALRYLRIRFPITLSRYKSMTTDNPAPMDKTFTILGNPPYSQKEGVKQTTEWLFQFWHKQNQSL
jgi:nucleoside-diphosphate-sugar epimerase